MRKLSSGGSVGRSRYRRANAALLLGVSFVPIVSVIGWIGGYRINTTPSEPLGLWRIVPLDRPVALGDLVAVCPPSKGLFAEARQRGYLRSGLCQDGNGPLIKIVIALEGQRVEVVDRVSVDGRDVVMSRLLQVDGKGRALKPYPGGIVPVGEVFLHSPYSGSWDSRYFGPVPKSGILGLAQEVLTYEP